MPGYANPQNLNRYSYVTNNPLRYTDPTGHMQYEDSYTSNNGICKPGDTSCNWVGKSKNKPKKEKSDSPIITSNGPHIGRPGDPGNFYGGYNGPGDFIQDSISSVGGDGECVSSVCSFSGGSIPLRYGASYDILQYDNLRVVVLHEHYWIPGTAVPLMENPTFGGSTLISQLSNGQQTAGNLGEFSPGSIAYPNRLTKRDTAIHYWGQENFPTQLVIKLTFGAQNMGAKTIYFQVPYVP